MSQMIRHATSEELNELMDTLLELDSMSKSQADLFCSAVDELKKRGELPEITEEETEEAIQRVWRRIESDEPDSGDVLKTLSAEELWDILRSAGPEQTELLTEAAKELMERGVEIPESIQSGDPEKDLAIGVVQELFLMGTTEDLTHMLKAMYTKDGLVKEQAHYLFSFTEELKRRGEPVPFTDEELRIREEEILQTARTFDDATERAEQKRLNKPPEKPEAPVSRAWKKPRFSRAAGFAAIVLALLFFTNVVTNAAGFDLFGRISAWTKDAIQYVFGITGEDDIDQEINTEFGALTHTLEALNINIDLPAYIPEGYTYHHTDPDEPDGSMPFGAWFTSGTKQFFIRVNPASSGVSSFFEASVAEGAERYNGEYIIIANNNRFTAIWAHGFCEVQIQGDLTREQLIKMLDSI